MDLFLRQGKALASDRDKVMGSYCFEHTAVDRTEQLSLEGLHYGGLLLLKLGGGVCMRRKLCSLEFGFKTYESVLLLPFVCL
jgi:hypothetical protein